MLAMQVLTKRLKIYVIHEQHVKKLSRHLPPLLYICGYGQHVHGSVFTLTMQSHFQIQIFCYWSTHTLNGHQHLVHQHRKLLKHYGFYFHLSSFGLPEQFVSDNGSQFTSQEFADFMKFNGIMHIKTAPYHPSSNGAIERLVQSFKKSMLASQGEKKSIENN